jgi:hypothetical protein
VDPEPKPPFWHRELAVPVVFLLGVLLGAIGCVFIASDPHGQWHWRATMFAAIFSVVFGLALCGILELTRRIGNIDRRKFTALHAGAIAWLVSIALIRVFMGTSASFVETALRIAATMNFVFFPVVGAIVLVAYTYRRIIARGGEQNSQTR